ncbi:MAG: hypothetical protein AAF208_12945 [Cyanobacteria bacterium P01_A01_bin.45]
MNSDNFTPPEEREDEFNLALFSIPKSLMLQMGTSSVLGILVTQKTATETLTALGKASEEIFRGDRLPTLDFPEPFQNNY